MVILLFQSLYYGTVKAGYNYLAQENWIGTIDVETSLVGNGDEYFALKVHGDSMFPVLVENDIVIIKKQSDFETGDNYSMNILISKKELEHKEFNKAEIIFE